tara:strand:- start:829 stop:1146 length:318 start_codon:yes stop_codon:yes gene_type:complete
MVQLSNKIEIYLDRKIDFTKDVILQNDSDGKGDYIKEWNVAEAQPTDAQLDALDAQATTLESNNQVDSTRRTAYGSWNDQLDEIYHDIDAWKARLQTIKINNPKS